MKKFDAIVAGAGIWGCTVARRLAESGRQVLVLEKRKAVGGNCRCRTIDGIEVHLYGSHIFHTADEAVWKFIKRFTDFNAYRHSVLAKPGKNDTGKNAPVFHLPIGKTLVREYFGVDLGERALKEFLSEAIPDRGGATYGEALFDAFIRGYTAKQWGMPAEQVDPAIIARLKVRDNYSTDYFDDPHQGIPLDGYNEMFRRMLAHENIVVSCNRDFTLATGGIDCPVYYSGPIDRLFDYRFGALPWRSLRFETEHLERRDFQGVTVVNYTDAAVPFTRIHEFRHYHPEAKGAFAQPKGTIITREFPESWRRGDEPYYPIDNEASRALVARYRGALDEYNEKARARGCELIVGGRLGGYRYYDMDKSVAAALALAL